MAIFHVATNTPSKAQIVGDWITQQPWGPASATDLRLLGSFHLNDPVGEVGMQVFLAGVGDEIYQIPLTYRAEPLDGADESFIARMEHSVLGTRHVYDGIGDHRFLTVLAGVTISGYGQALGFANHDDRWYAWAETVRLQPSGSVIGGRLAVDGFSIVATTEDDVVVANDEIELTFFRRLFDRPVPPVGLIATCTALPDPISIVAVRQLPD